MAPSSRAWTPARGMVRGCLVQVAATAFVLGWLGCAVGATALIPVDRDLRPIVGVLAFGSILPVMMVAGAGFLLWNRRRLARLLDAAVAPLGLTGQPLMTLGRHYHGTVDGRPVHAQFNRGPVFELWVEVPTATRAAILAPNALQRRAAGALKAGEEIPLPGAQVSAYSQDRPWVEQLLAQPGVTEALDRLARPEQPRLAWQRRLGIGPRGLHLHLYRVGLGALTPERVQAWSADLFTLAAAIEAIGPSTAGQEERGLERQHREDPGALARKAGCIVALVVVLLVAVSVVVTAAAFLVVQR